MAIPQYDSVEQALGYASKIYDDAVSAVTYGDGRTEFHVDLELLQSNENTRLTPEERLQTLNNGIQTLQANGDIAAAGHLEEIRNIEVTEIAPVQLQKSELSQESYSSALLDRQRADYSRA